MAAPGAAHSSGHRDGAAGAWRQAFLRMPYWRDPAVGMGVIMDTFETAVIWDRFADFFSANVKADVARAIERITGLEAHISCRLTHVYPDGPAPYFAFVTRPADGSVASALAAWREIKLAANAAIIDHGGTSTHHHAVGHDHRNAYEREVDPRGILNPGVLLDPMHRRLGITGALVVHA